MLHHVKKEWFLDTKGENRLFSYLLIFVVRESFFAMGQNFEISSLRLRNDIHLLRKLWHVGTGIFGLSLYFSIDADPINTACCVLILAGLGFFLDILRMRFSHLNSVALRFMGPFMRESERKSFSGLPFYALGVALSLFLFPEKIAILSILFLVFSDPISSYIGILFGKDKILPNKSLQGTLAGFITCYLVTLIYSINISFVDYNLLGFSLLAGIIGSLSELTSVFGIDDNLTIPLLSGLGLTVINLIFNIF